MAIRNRHGVYDKFIPKKLVPGEFAFVRSGDPNAKDGKTIYAAFDAGYTKRLATYEDMVENIALAADDVVKEVAGDLQDATERANLSASEAEAAATEASKAAEEAEKAIEGSKAPVYKSDGFPVTGEVGRLYIDDTVDPRVIYTWDNEKGYVLTGGKQKELLSDEFDPGSTYATGDYAIYENVLYKFTGDKTAGEWDESVVSATKVDAELQALKKATDELNSKIKKETITTTTDSNGNVTIGSNQNIVIVSAYSYGYICLPFMADFLYVKIVDGNLQSVAGQNITIEYTYIII